MVYVLKLLDVVALTRDVPDRGLVRGQVGTIVELLGPAVFEVEFADEDGRTYSQAALAADGLILLRYRPARAA